MFGQRKQGLLGICYALLSLVLVASGCEFDKAEFHESELFYSALTENNNHPPLLEIPDIPTPTWDVIEVMARTNPRHPQNERFVGDWELELFNITDQGRPFTASFFTQAGPDGTAAAGLPSYMFALPLVIKAHNKFLALDCQEKPKGKACEQSSFEIFVPAYCFDKNVWMAGPLESAVWQYYKKAASRGAHAWVPSQVDCGTWLANMQLLILTETMSDALDDFGAVDQKTLDQAWQENQQFLVPTRPPLCLAANTHKGGKMKKGSKISNDLVFFSEASDGNSLIKVENGVASNVCGVELTGKLHVNKAVFAPVKNFQLKDDNFVGVIQEQNNIVNNINVSVYNVKLGNGRDRDSDVYNDACALSSVVEFSNTDDDYQDVLKDSGILFTDLFGGGPNATSVYKTSSGDSIVDEDDTWAIFSFEERVLAVELGGHRAGDFRDPLHMQFDPESDHLFLGLRTDYELNEENTDGERAFLHYTIHAWDASSEAGKKAIGKNFANCYEAADLWARQFIRTTELEKIQALDAAEFAVRSQCFSNSRANQRWGNESSAFWSINNNKGVLGNVIVNPGWLAPNLEFEVYIQKFDEAVFKGPRVLARTDNLGQLMVEMPTLVEGDRVLLKAQDSCCSDYDLVLPCIQEFIGFQGAPGVPYVPQIIGPPPGFFTGPVGPGLPIPFPESGDDDVIGPIGPSFPLPPPPPRVVPVVIPQPPLLPPPPSVPTFPPRR